MLMNILDLKNEKVTNLVSDQPVFKKALDKQSIPNQTELKQSWVRPGYVYKFQSNKHNMLKPDLIYINS